ncbi:MAG: hypothetical protein R3C02_17945 [Planctomycetaceae bacterium]
MQHPRQRHQHDLPGARHLAEPRVQSQAQVIEAIVQHQRVTKAEARRRTIQLFEEVGIPDRNIGSTCIRMRCPADETAGHDRDGAFVQSGVLIADEPTTALDVTIQSRFSICRGCATTVDTPILFITHDLAVIARSQIRWL